MQIKVNEIDFRVAERRFWVLEEDELSAVALSEEYEQDYKAILFCYVKAGECIAFEIVGKTNGEKVVTFCDDIPRKVYFDTVYEGTLTQFGDADAINDLLPKVNAVIEKEYNSALEVVATRQISELDHLRQRFYPDVIEVYTSINPPTPALAQIKGVNESGALEVSLVENGIVDEQVKTLEFFNAQTDNGNMLVAVVK